MEKILFVTDVASDGSFSKVSLEVLAGAAGLSKDLGASLAVGLIGSEVQKAADSISGCGADEFLGVSGPEFSESRYSSDAAALEAIARQSQASIVIGPATLRLARAFPGVSCRMGGSIDTHISGTVCEEGTLHVQRWFYRQRVSATLTRQARPWFLLVDSGVFQAVEREAGSARLENVTVELSEEQKKTRVTGMEAPSAEEQTIRPDAQLLFVAGAGWTKKQADGQMHLQDAEKQILGFLNNTKASLGSSKSLVDQSVEGEEVLGFMSHLNQVGQTGSTPRHPKGLATCCHGEEPHVVGWRFISERRAVNLDAGCGWAQGKADVLYVGDAFEVMEKVNQLLGE
ncbi:electron transfer flavoprotein subunit alpha/FixB family protein [Fibrobacterota bacterium]